MKKYLLGLLAIPFSLISFSSANICQNTVFTDQDGIYIVKNFNAGDKFSLEFNQDYEGQFEGCYYIFGNSFDGTSIDGVLYNSEFGGEIYSFTSEIAPAGTSYVEVGCDENFCENVDMSIIQGGTEGGGTEGGGTEGGGTEGGGTEGGGNAGGGVISNGFNDLTPAVNGLRGTVYQIIPFVLYIGIGLLIAILGFYAIRWLVNWIGLKVNSYFRSKRD